MEQSQDSAAADVERLRADGGLVEQLDDLGDRCGLPQPCLELVQVTGSEDPLPLAVGRLKATRVKPPGTMLTSLPDSTKGRKSMWRGAKPDSAKVGQVDSARVGCAM